MEVGNSMQFKDFEKANARSLVHHESHIVVVFQ